MSTNYYANIPGADAHKDSPDDPGIHIGKYSAGVEFAWRAHPDLGLDSADDWVRLLRSLPDGVVVPEHHAPTATDEFLTSALGRRSQQWDIHHGTLGMTSRDPYHYRDVKGYLFTTHEFC